MESSALKLAGSQLFRLKPDSIHIRREAVAAARNPVMLFFAGPVTHFESPLVVGPFAGATDGPVARRSVSACWAAASPMRQTRAKIAIKRRRTGPFLLASDTEVDPAWPGLADTMAYGFDALLGGLCRDCVGWVIGGRCDGYHLWDQGVRHDEEGARLA